MAVFTLSRMSNWHLGSIGLPERHFRRLSARRLSAMLGEAGELAANGLQAPIVSVIHSMSARQNGSVASSMKAYFERISAAQDAALLCSHAAIFDTPLPPDPQTGISCLMRCQTA